MTLSKHRHRLKFMVEIAITIRDRDMQFASKLRIEITIKKRNMQLRLASLCFDSRAPHDFPRGTFLAGGVNCGSIELCKDEEYYHVEVNRFPENAATALLCVIEDGQRREQVFGGANAVDYECTEARRLAKEKLEHGFMLKRGSYGCDGTYGYLTGFK